MCGRGQVEPLVFTHKDEMIHNDDFIALADRRIFAVMAFINLCGYDEENKYKEMHPVRLQVRHAMQKKSAEHLATLDEWRQYYQKSNKPGFIYLNYALTLSDDYPFRRIRPDSELWQPSTGEVLTDFPAVLNRFWKTLEMEQIWMRVKPKYMAELHQYDFDRMNHQLVFIWNYLRLERSDRFVFVSVPNLLDSHYHAIGSKSENYWYMVEGPDSGSHGMNEHEYLHSIINPLIENNYDSHKVKLDEYYHAGQAFSMNESYSHPVGYAYECMVRAVDHRIRILLDDNPSTIQRLEDQVAWLTKEGLLLVKPFYQLLSTYESNTMNFEEFMPIILKRIPEYSNRETCTTNAFTLSRTPPA